MNISYLNIDQLISTFPREGRISEKLSESLITIEDRYFLIANDGIVELEETINPTCSSEVWICVRNTFNISDGKTLILNQLDEIKKEKEKEIRIFSTLLEHLEELSLLSSSKEILKKKKDEMIRVLTFSMNSLKSISPELTEGFELTIRKIKNGEADSQLLKAILEEKKAQEIEDELFNSLEQHGC